MSLRIELIHQCPDIARIIHTLTDDDLATFVSTIVAHINHLPSLQACQEAWVRLEKVNDATIVSKFASKLAHRTVVRQPMSAMARRKLSVKGKINRRRAKMAKLEAELKVLSES